MNRMLTWLKQQFCKHDMCSWETEHVSPSTTRWTGGCDNCGKPLSPYCPTCGRWPLWLALRVHSCHRSFIGDVIPWEGLDPFLQSMYLDLDGDIQCRNTAAYEYGQEIRCSNIHGHEGECKP